jgi:diguanylate cyclase (GGDEF)-like protein
VDDPAVPLTLVRRAQAAEGPLARILRDPAALHAVFQPIASLGDGGIHAHEALIRGPRGMPLHSPDALLAAARREDLLLEFELACVRVVLTEWSRLRQPGRLFLNLSAEALVAGVHAGTHDVLAWLRSLGIPPRMLVIELTEHERVADIASLEAVVREVQQAGLSIALDDFGDGRSSLRLWSELKPGVVKIDKYFTKDISRHADKLQTLRALMQIGETFSTLLVAEGIETEDDLRVLRDLGLNFGQGYFIGRPEPSPRENIEAAAARVLADSRVAVMPQRARLSSLAAGRPLQPVAAPAVSMSTSCDALADLFRDNPGLHAVAVVEQDRPVGILARQAFMDRYSKLYFKELYGRKPCFNFANSAPRLIEREHDIDQLIGILTSQDQRYLAEGFVITDNGRYVGMGTGEQLVRTVTEARIEAARHANPLTFLPGNIPISQHIERLVEKRAEFAAAYADLNSFKPFNDHYGYWRGDELIRLLARVITGHCDPQRDFVGHVGGDDFVMLFQSSDWQARCEAIVAEFNDAARQLYDDAARQAGGIEAEDRDGVRRFFRFTTLSIGLVCVGRDQPATAESVASAAARAKHEAKVSGVGVHQLAGAPPQDQLSAPQPVAMRR